MKIHSECMVPSYLQRNIKILFMTKNIINVYIAKSTTLHQINSDIYIFFSVNMQLHKCMLWWRLWKAINKKLFHKNIKINLQIVFYFIFCFQASSDSKTLGGTSFCV